MGHRNDNKRKVGRKKVKSLPAEPGVGSISALLKVVEIQPEKSQEAGEGIALTKESVKPSSRGKSKSKNDPSR